MNYDREIMWKENLIAFLKVQFIYFDISLEEHPKTTRDLRQDSRPPDRNSNQGPLESNHQECLPLKHDIRSVSYFIN